MSRAAFSRSGMTRTPSLNADEVQRALCAVDLTLDTQFCHGENSTFWGNVGQVNDNTLLTKFPTLTFTLADSVTISFPPAQYLASVPTELAEGNENVRHNLIRSSGDDAALILGGAALSGHWILFDRAAKRLGFAPTTDCSEHY